MRGFRIKTTAITIVLFLLGLMAIQADANAAAREAIGHQSDLCTWVFLAVAAIGGSLLSAWLISRLLRNLNNALGLFQKGSIQLDNLAEGLTGSGRMLFDGASQQMASIKGTSAATTEMLGTSQKNSLKTREASVKIAALVKHLDSVGSAVSSAGDSMSKTRELIQKMAHIAMPSIRLLSRLTCWPGMPRLRPLVPANQVWDSQLWPTKYGLSPCAVPKPPGTPPI